MSTLSTTPATHSRIDIRDEAAAAAIPYELGAAEWFRRVVATDPSATALVTASASCSYADLDRWSDAIAADLLAAKSPVDRPVAVLTRDNVRLAAALLGVIKAGRFFVMVDAADPAERIALLLRESGAALCLAERGASLPLELSAIPRVVIREQDEARDASAPPEQPLNEFVFVIFTSGTTGKPKGVLTPQHGFVRRTVRGSVRNGRLRGERLLYTALPGFARATNTVFGALLMGATLCAFDARGEDLNALASWIARQRITFLSLPPSLYRRLMASKPASLDLSSVRTLRIGADRKTLADIAAFKANFPRGCALSLGYASTESGPAFGMRLDHDTPVEGPLVPMGRPFPGIDVWILDEEGNEVADGETGELVIRSEDVIEGYWKDADQASARFRVDADGRRTVHTGDLVKRDATGLYYFVGRADARLKIHGRRIDASEVEAAIFSAAPGVAECAVVGKPDTNGELRLVAYVVVKPGAPFEPRELRARLRSAHPAWMVPARIHPIDSLPYTRGGKLDRAALTARVDPESAEETGARDELEAQLAEIWTRVIGTPVHVNDDFFDDLGGESVVAAHLVAEVEKGTGKTLALSQLIELNTIVKMAAHLRTFRHTNRIAIAVKPQGSKPPLFCVAGMGGSVMVFRTLAAGLGDRPLWGLTFHGFDAKAYPPTSTAMAKRYVEAAREVQPNGPYFLAGYSGGGKMALEMARLLVAAGEKVAFVGLLDSSAGGKAPTMLQRIANRLDMLRQDPVRRIPQFTREFAMKPARWGWRIVRKPLARAGLAKQPPVPGPHYLARRAQTRDYSTAPYHGLVGLFRARNGLGYLGRREDLGWRALGVTRLEIIDVRGDHVTMLEEPSLARAMRDALDTAQLLLDAESASAT